MLQIIIKSVELQSVINHERKNGLKIGFVPTMGALHEGHISLIGRSSAENQITVSSIFVNPTQFNDGGDFSRYPRTIDKDIEMLAKTGCNYVFIPTVEEIYPEESFKSINFIAGELGEVLEGTHRPGHFAGVAAVVKRLFEIVHPHIAYFGQKDFQQFLIIKKLVADFHIPIEVKACLTLREEDGLAMSSRNTLLTSQQRLQAAFLYKMLQKAKSMIMSGENDRQLIIKTILSEFELNGNFTVDYFDICSAESLQRAYDFSKGEIIICVAAFLGNIRLIDNVLV